MPYCSQCAKPLDSGAKFCTQCGSAIAPAASAAAPSVPQPAPTAPPAAPAMEPVAPALGLTEDVTRTSGPTPNTPLPPTSSPHGRFEPGTRLGSRYRIVALLGRGGMGEVYRADDLELGQSVALKFLPPGVATDPRELARFRNEVRVARQIAHPNVCRVYDIGEADGHVFLSMEYIDGEDLSAVLRRMGRPTEDKACEIARQVALGLAAAHEAGMLHRDLKPANIMIDGRGRARITDFGLAGLAVELARGGQVAGTPAYMAPEQFADGTVSVRSDIYSLGLVLYELFTGKRAFDAKNAAELRAQHDTSSITSPSTLARGITPAVERLILHCLERDPDSRPPSAYAVLGALPGGDPLAAAMAAGETPSPELVANASDRGGLEPMWALGLIALVIGMIALASWLLTPDFKVLKQTPSALEVRAEDVLRKSGAFDALPPYVAGTFAQNDAWAEWRLKHSKDPDRAPATAYYWRRWAPRLIESPYIHAEIPGVNAPVTLGNSSAMVLLSPDGKLVGFRAEPPDSVPTRNGGKPTWNAWFAAFGMDSSAYTPVALARPVPALCDTAMAWRGPSPWGAADTVTVQMGASRGRLTHFSVVNTWGVLATPVDKLPPNQTQPTDLLFTLLFTVIPDLLAIYFTMRNLQNGRGDWRGATRIAVFVFVMNWGEAVFATHLSEVGIDGVLGDLFSGRAMGHALMHAMEMWFAYVALEPFVRRIWPRVLVSWTRLLTGRLRDPLVGRDLLVGVALGCAITALGLATFASGQRLGMGKLPVLTGGGMFEAAGSPGYEAVRICYAGSVCILGVLQSLLSLLLLRLVSRRTDVAVAVTFLLYLYSNSVGGVSQVGWTISLISGFFATLGVLLIIRIGLLASVVAAFVGLVQTFAVMTLDLNSWYAGLVLLPMALLLAIAAYGAATALAGKSILGDPLGEAERH
jgi:serine/threonine-protein kinase